MSIYKNRLGIFMLDLTVGGKRIRISLKTRDRKLARDIAKVKEIELQESFRLNGKSISEFIEYYLVWLKPRREPTTYRGYKSVLKNFQNEIGVQQLGDVNRLCAERFIAGLALPRVINKKERTMTGRGINYYIRSLRAIFNDAVQMEIIASNPFTGIQLMKENTIKPRIMRRSEIKLFFEKLQIHYPQYFDLFIVYLLTGIRRSEALEIAWEDVRFDADSIIIHGKGDKYRIVPMLPVVSKIFLARRELSKPFSWHESTPTHVFGKICKLAGIEGARLHDMRKTFSTMLAEQGISDLLIKEWLGHEDDKVTRMHYIGFNDESVRKRMKKLQKELVGSNLPAGLLTRKRRKSI